MSNVYSGQLGENSNGFFLNFFQQSFIDDDPDKEKKIKELELLLMSVESEIRRKRASSVRTVNFYKYLSMLY